MEWWRNGVMEGWSDGVTPYVPMAWAVATPGVVATPLCGVWEGERRRFRVPPARRHSGMATTDLSL
jgi:hypothetical protein